MSSGTPSPSTSAAATFTPPWNFEGYAATWNSCVPPVGSVPLRTLTIACPSLPFATTKSFTPSPLKSALAT